VAQAEETGKEHSIFARKSLEKLSLRRWRQGWEGTIAMHQTKMGCKDFNETGPEIAVLKHWAEISFTSYWEHSLTTYTSGKFNPLLGEIH
jgi:hypothetical protein